MNLQGCGFLICRHVIHTKGPEGSLAPSASPRFWRTGQLDKLDNGVPSGLWFIMQSLLASECGPSPSSLQGDLIPPFLYSQ